MFSTNLFLGFAIDQNYRNQLDKIPEPMRSLYIRDEDDYLRLLEIDGNCYAGKFLGEIMHLSSLELVSAHIISLLKCLVPSYPYSEKHLVLLAFAASEICKMQP